MKKLILFSTLITFFFLLSTFYCLAQWMPTSVYYPTVGSFAVRGDTIFAGTDGNGVYRSSNNGSSWVAVDTGLTSIEIYALAIKEDTLFAGTYFGVSLSVNNGSNWVAVDTGLTSIEVCSFALKADTIFAGTHGNGVYLSSNNGSSWKYVDSGLTGYELYVNALAVSGNKIFAGTGIAPVSCCGVFVSLNGGISWSAAAFGSMIINAIATKGDTIFVGTAGDGVYVSTDTGHTWSSKSTGLPYAGLSVFSLLIKENYIFAGTAYGVYVSSINGGNWVAINDGFPISPADSNLLVQTFYALAANDTYIFAGATSYSGELGQQAGVWRRPLSQVITGINEVKGKENNVVVYPNPATSIITIDIPKAAVGSMQEAVCKIEICNLLGEEVYSTTNYKPSTTNNIDVSAFPNGVYFIKVTTEKGVVVKRFVKE